MLVKKNTHRLPGQFVERAPYWTMDTERCQSCDLEGYIIDSGSHYVCTFCGTVCKEVIMEVCAEFMHAAPEDDVITRAQIQFKNQLGRVCDILGLGMRYQSEMIEYYKSVSSKLGAYSMEARVIAIIDIVLSKYNLGRPVNELIAVGFSKTGDVNETIRCVKSLGEEISINAVNYLKRLEIDKVFFMKACKIAPDAKTLTKIGLAMVLGGVSVDQAALFSGVSKSALISILRKDSDTHKNKKELVEIRPVAGIPWMHAHQLYYQGRPKGSIRFDLRKLYFMKDYIDMKGYSAYDGKEIPITPDGEKLKRVHLPFLSSTVPDTQGTNGTVKLFSTGIIEIYTPWDGNSNIDECIQTQIHDSGAGACIEFLTGTIDMDWDFTCKKVQGYCSVEEHSVSDTSQKIGGTLRSELTKGHPGIELDGMTIYSTKCSVQAKSFHEFKENSIKLKNTLESAGVNLLDTPQVSKKHTKRKVRSWDTGEDVPSGFFMRPDPHGNMKLYKIPNAKYRGTKTFKTKLENWYSAFGYEIPKWVLDRLGIYL